MSEIDEVRGKGLKGQGLNKTAVAASDGAKSNDDSMGKWLWHLVRGVTLGFRQS